MVRRLKEIKTCNTNKYELVENIRSHIKRHDLINIKSKITTPYEYYSDYAPEDIDFVIENLDENLRKIFEKRFDKFGCSKEIRREFSYNLSTFIKTRLNSLKRKRILEGIYDIDENNPYKDEVKEAIESILIIGLRNGYIHDKKFSDDEISKMFNIEEDMIDKKTTVALSLYSLDSIEEISKDIYVRYTKENNLKKREVRKKYNEKRQRKSSIK